jgi:transposase InsO family protein
MRGLSKGIPVYYQTALEEIRANSAKWLFKLGVALIYSTPHHPQSRGKNKRFRRTLSDEVFALRAFQSLETAQYALDG